MSPGMCIACLEDKPQSISMYFIQFKKTDGILKRGASFTKLRVYCLNSDTQLNIKEDECVHRNNFNSNAAVYSNIHVECSFTLYQWSGVCLIQQRHFRNRQVNGRKIHFVIDCTVHAVILNMNNGFRKKELSDRHYAYSIINHI